jgi:antitoxin component HigA of HigAB toxin-antitoxin module
MGQLPKFTLTPIRSEEDYDAALAEVERLWAAKSGTVEGDRIDVLATLADAYEAEHHPIDPPDPIEATKFRMEQQHLTLYLTDTIEKMPLTANSSEYNSDSLPSTSWRRSADDRRRRVAAPDSFMAL